MFFLIDGPTYQWLLMPFIIYGRYFFLCSWLFGLFYLWKKRDWLYLKIQQRYPRKADYWREAGYSALTALIFGLVAALMLGTPLRAYTLLYTDVAEYGVPYLILSVVLVIVLHDTYFYWMHRLMHHPKLYRYIHLVHHKSVNPSPWAAYSFHPVEAVIEAGILPLVLFLMPLHPIAIMAFVTIMLWFNVYGHLGYELFPKWMYDHPLGRWLNTSVYHNLHHERFHGNYSLYFTFWDRVMGTMRTDNEAKLAEVQDRITQHRAEKATVYVFNDEL
ncbi:MAG: fatty acid hydroxylase family protein [Bacteroidetes bacterium]|nr:MAG: fatty acid hydroxylase family protein [Bacteroidota bacterium]